MAITIPLVLAATFLAMWYWNIGLHKVSLGSLIIALGLLVDDAIIAVEMMVRKMEEGYEKYRAATFAYEITAKPMLTGTLITAAGFLPIGMAKSMTGEYTFAIFAVTVIALVLSWFASVYFVPYLGMLLLKRPPHAATLPPEVASGEVPIEETNLNASSAEHEVFDSPFYNRFRRAVNWCVTHRWLTIAITVLVFALGLVGMSRVQQQFFPDSSRPEVLVDIWFPEGTSLAANEAVTRRVEERFMKLDGVRTVSEWVGSGVPRFYLPLDQVFPQNNVSQFILVAQDLPTRERLRKALPALLAQEFPEVRGRVSCCPTGLPCPIRCSSASPAPTRKAAGLCRRGQAGHDRQRRHARRQRQLEQSVKAVRLEVDQDKARALGVSSQAIAQAARVMLSGSTVGQFREGDKLIDIVLRTPYSERDAITDIANAYLPTASGKSIPLTQIAKPVMVWEPGVMWRESACSPSPCRAMCARACRAQR